MDNAVQPTRPASKLLERSFTAFYSDPLLSVPRLRSYALAGLVPQRGLRSLHWRYFFGLLPSPSGPSSSTSANTIDQLTKARAEYSELREKYLRSPDGGWVNDGGEGGVGTSERRGSRGDGPGSAKPAARVDVQVNNPLGLDDANQWNAWFKDLELRRVIRQDVQRTFPELDYFRSASVQDQMTDILFILIKHFIPDIGYRQGMHELLAIFVWVTDWDSLDPASPPSTSPSLSKNKKDDTAQLAHVILSREYVEHDAWALFSALMNSAKRLYDHTPSVPMPVDRAAASTTSLTLSHSAGFASSSSSSNTTVPEKASVLVQPIVGTAIRIHDKLLKTVDHALWAKMEKEQIEPQLYALRWLRLLFGREFPLGEHLILLDGLFAEDPTLRLCEYVCVAMLLRIRTALLASDYSSFIQLLLRYPALSDGSHRPSVLLQQAILLRDDTSAEAGARVRAYNQENGTSAGQGTGAEDEEENTPRRTSQVRPSSMVGPGLAISGLLQEGGLLGDAARGVWGRTEALGLNRALLGAVNEIRRGVNGGSSSPRGDPHLSQIPSHAPWEQQNRPPAAPAKDYLSEIGKMRQTSLEMARALELCINVLEAHLVLGPPPTPSQTTSPAQPPPPTSRQEEDEESGAADVNEGASSLHLQKTAREREREASAALLPPSPFASAQERPLPSGETLMCLATLKHVRDVLGGQAQVFDAGVLSPLQHALASGRFPDQPPRSPVGGSPHPPPSPKKQPETLATPPVAVHKAQQSNINGAPLMLGARTDKPLPSLTRTPQAAHVPPPALPRVPQTTASGAAHAATETVRTSPIIQQQSAPPEATAASGFPASGFSTRPRPAASKIVDPLGAAAEGGVN